MLDTYIEGYNRITVDVYTREGVIVGPGPLMTCLGLEFDRVLSNAGTFRARFLGSEPRFEYIFPKAHLLKFYYGDDNRREKFLGLYENSRSEVDETGQLILVVEGRDMLGELDEIPLDNFYVGNAVTPIQLNVGGILMTANNFISHPDRWNEETQLTAGYVYAKFEGESVLASLIRVSQQLGEMFFLGNPNQPEEDFHLTWGYDNSGGPQIRAIQSVGDTVDAESSYHTCFIQRFSRRIMAEKMITRIYPWGSGFGETHLDLLGTTRTAPEGYTLNAQFNYIENAWAAAYVTQPIAKHIHFKEIRPLYNTDADMIAAKNYLFDAGLAFLRRNYSIYEFAEYDLEVANLPPTAHPGILIRVIYQDDMIRMDETLYILGIRVSVDSDGAVSYRLTVSRQPVWRLQESSKVLASMEEGEILSGHPQIDANSWWENFKEEVGDNQIEHVAEFPFVLGVEIVTIRQVVFRYRVDRLLSGSKTYAYASPNTNQNVAADTGDAAVTVESNVVSVEGQVVTINGEVVDVNTASISVAVDPALPGTWTNENPTPLDTNSIAPDAFTETNHLDIGETTISVQNWSPDPSLHHHTIAHHVHDFTHTHTIESHTHYASILPTLIVTPANHDHSTVSHTHVAVSHAHTTIAHAHTSPVHHHTSPQHVHAAPTLVESFAINRIPALNSYVLADLEYRVNGNAWKGLELGTPVGGGFYEEDITIHVQQPGGLLRPYQQDNLIEVRRKSAAALGKSAMVRAKLGIRCTIQSVVSY